MLVISYQEQQFAYPLPFWSKNKTQQGRDEENLYFGAAVFYDQVYMHPCGIVRQAPGIPSAQFALPHIAKHYGLDRNEIVQVWSKEYGIWRALGHMPANPALEGSRNGLR